jgi:phospholipid transport system transporter-binding protein
MKDSPSVSAENSVRVDLEPSSDQPDRLYLLGSLVLPVLMEFKKYSDSVLKERSQVSIDLSKIKRIDSAGLALLIEWVRQAGKRGQSLRFLNVPEQISAMIRVSGLETVLPIFHDELHD